MWTGYVTKSVHISRGKLNPPDILMHKHTKYDLVKRRITSIPSLAEIVVVHFHTKTPLVPQKEESVTSARSQIISPAYICRSAVKPKQCNSNSRKPRKTSDSRKPGLRHDGMRQLQENESSDTESGADDEYFYAVNCTKPAKEIPYVNMKIQGNKIRMTVDTGATINVLDRRTFDQMTNNLQPTNVKAYAYNTTTPVKFLGKFEAAIETERRYAVATFYVVQDAKSARAVF